MKIKEFLKTYYRRWRNKKVSYAQTGEDILADFYLFGQKNGFYVDIGANDPIFLSNTFYFYKKGWRGICIEPNAFRANLIHKTRPRDTVLNIGLASQKSQMDFFVFDPDTISTFSYEESEANKKAGYRLVSTQKVQVMTLTDLFEKYAPNQSVDLLTTDTEGLDLEILQSNNWQKFRPKLIVAEVAEYRGKTVIRQEKAMSEFLFSQGYKKLADTYINGIYIEQDYAKSRNLNF